jgi:ribose-phosphate pyrophosphokinase
VIDDLVSAGTTIARTASACRERGATRVLAAATHGVFAGEANATLGSGPVDEIAVTDTIAPWRVGPPLRARLVLLSAAGLFAEAIRRLHAGGSISELSLG